jgi:hypothetical protein
MGFLIVWAVLLLIFAFVQMGHHIELSKRSVWMDRVDEKLNVHEGQLNLLAIKVAELPEATIKRFNEVYKKP